MSNTALALTTMLEDPIEIAQPYMKVLGQIIFGTNHVAMLSYANGRIVDMVGDSEHNCDVCGEGKS